MTINIKKTIPLLFEQQAKQSAQRTALVSDKETLTYQQLNQRANQLAHYLKHLGVAPEKLVALHLGRSIQAIVTILAIFKAGGAYLPLDCNDPIQRLQFILNESQAAFFITQSRAELPSGLDKSITIIILDELDEILKQQPITNPTASAKMHNLAYVMYTSGSTGKPKGVEIEHKGLPSLMKHQIKQFQITKSSHVIQFASLTFDVSVLETWITLLSGASLYIVPGCLRANPQGVLDYICKHKISIAALPPTLIIHLPRTAHTSLKTLIAIGDSCTKQAMDFWNQHCRVINSYGPTETTITSVTFVYDGTLHQCIGAAVANTECYVLNTKRELIKPGQTGELYIGGIGLARGYRNQPKLTNKSFIYWNKNTDKNSDKSLLYRTGDRVRLLPNGLLEYIGRIDFQIKFNGIRIEPGEIESIISQHPSIHQSVVALKAEDDHQYLTAYMLKKEKKEITEEAMRDYLKKQLPLNRTPNAFLFLDSFPLLNTGKVNRALLPKPTFNKKFTKRESLTTNQNKLRRIWSKVLKVKERNIDLESNFFNLGGSSFYAVKLILEIKKEINIPIEAIDLIKNPTLKELSSKIENLNKSKKKEITIERSEELEAPISFPQRRIWLAYEKSKRKCPHIYNVNITLEMTGDLQIKSLQKALQCLIDNHESLRTYFPEIGIQKAGNIKIKLNKEKLKKGGELKERIEESIHRAYRHDFGDLSKPPLVYAKLIEVNENRFILVLVFHHIIIEITSSLNTITNELEKIYNHYIDKDPKKIDIQKNASRYIDFSLWQQNLLKKGLYRKPLNYWKNQLKDFPSILNLPTDKPHPKNPTYQGSEHTLSFPKEIINGLQLIAKQNGSTLFSLMLSSISILLYRYSQQKEFIIGVTHSQRPQPSFDQVIGFFVNMLPIRIQQKEKASFIQTLNRIQSTLTQAYKNNAPIEEIISQLSLPNYSNLHPLFQVSVTMHERRSKSINFKNINTKLWRKSLIHTGNIDSAKFDLGFEMEKMRSGCLKIKIEYSTDLFFSSTIKQMANSWLELCRSIVKNPNSRIDSLPLLSYKQTQKLLTKWSTPEPHYSEKKTILQIFNQKVKEKNSSIAIVDGDLSLTYKELNEKANRLAHYLLSLEDLSKNENIIAIALERSADFIISVLAVLKTGSAYLPLDLSSAPKRLEFMLNDASTKIVITKQYISKKITKNNIPCIYLDRKSTMEILTNQPTYNPKKKINPTNLSYIMYTSGSTGEPKGVMIENRSIINLVKLPNYINLSKTEIIAHTSSIAFDASTFEIWGSLLNGHTMVIIPKQVLLDNNRFKKILEDSKITILTIPSLLFKKFLSIDIEIFKSIKWILFFGEKLADTQILTKLLETKKSPLQHIINIYGPTENTVYSLSFDITTSKWKEGCIPIGKNVQTTSTYVLDKQMQPVPAGMPGELYIGGIGLARGYLNRRKLTKEKFINNPFIKNGSRLYRTGDLVKYQPDGNITFMGRIDHQVKLSGYRIELGEIEHRLLLFRNIKETIVIKNMTYNNETLIAYIILYNRNINLEEYKDKLYFELKRHLPYYMIPSEFIFLDSLPINANGKLDRQQLLFSIRKQKQRIIKETDKAKTEVENKLLEIWSKVLKTSDISINDDFFSLGGNSLLAMQLTAMINDNISKSSYSDLFSCPTIKNQAKLIETPKEKRKRNILSLKYFKNESLLGRNITLNKTLIPSSEGNYKNILLTGATGFLGAFLLDELLHDKNCIIYCLIRAKNKYHARERLLKTIQKYKLEITIDDPRLKIIVGDISKHLFGLKQEEHRKLEKEINIIYHSASIVNFVKPYSSLRDANVLGMKNILRFSISQALKPLHYISSVAVFSFKHYFNHKKTLFKERSPLWNTHFEKALPHDLGYTQSKAVAEELVWQAINRGIPVSIHRPGFILCHSRNGIGNANQLWARFIRGCISLGYFPVLTDLKEEFITVDYASKAIIEISKQPNCAGKAFHIVPSSENNLTTNDLFNMIRREDIPLIGEPFAKWRERLKNHIAAGHSSELELLLPLFTDTIDNGLSLLEVYQHSPHFSRENTENALCNSQVIEQPLEPAIIKRYIAWLMGDNR